jgi:hypothetical protein
MNATRSASPTETLAIGCHRCDGVASIRRGKMLLCPGCAISDTNAPTDPPLVLCDLCERESLVRAGERFLCAGCALGVLFIDANEAEAIGRLARDGAMRLSDIAAAHHQALARSMERAHDPAECLQRVEAGAILFDVWAASFDARQEELELKNAVLVQLSEELDRQVDELGREQEEMCEA